MRTTQFQPTFVKYIPEKLEKGKLYISMEYATASHLCACGCGEKVVTPISPDFWPAFFYHGMVLRDLGKTQQANECFAKCKNLISDFGNKSSGGSIPYDFTLDSFSPSYIYSLCETFSMRGGF